MKKQTVKSLRNKCDVMLSPLIAKKHPNCLLCGKPTTTAHHHVHKSKSNRLRYEEINLINLCSECHFKLHQNESYYASKIVAIKGLKWFQKLEKMKQETIKCDIIYYQKQYEKLSTDFYSQ